MMMSLKRFNELTADERFMVEGAFMDYMGIDSVGVPGLPIPSIILNNLLKFAGDNFNFDQEPLQISRIGYMVFKDGKMVESHFKKS